MLQPRITALALAGLAALCCVAACEESAPACVVDADCGSGFRCTAEGSCERLPPVGEGGSGGGGPALDECEGSDDCLAEPFDLVPDVYWDGSPLGELVCTVPLLSCPSGGCPVPKECRPILEGATLPGLLRCELDSDCWSGRCLTREGIRFCLRSCTEDADCPFTDKTGGEPTGFVCEQLVDRGVPLQSCVPMDPAAPGRTLCRDDCDCGLPGACAPEAGLACRFLGKNLPRLRAVPVCEPLLDDPGRESGSRCRSDPLSCHGGACNATCADSGGNMPVVFCEEPRCTQPCDRDSDCPERLVCSTGAESERVGTWRAIGAGSAADEGRNIKYCLLPRNGCEDEQDCCPRPDGAGGCLDGWGPARRRCAVASSGPEAAPRLITVCADLNPALAAPGACCAAPTDCDSALCVPARDGTPCAGGGVCSVPCESDPDAGTGADTTPAKDRCATADFGGNLYHQGSSCLPFDYELPTKDGAGTIGSRTVTLRVCR